MKRASDNLVRAAQKAAFGKADDDDVVVKTKFVGGIAQVSGQTHSGVRACQDRGSGTAGLLNVTGCGL